MKILVEPVTKKILHGVNKVIIIKIKIILILILFNKIL